MNQERKAEFFAKILSRAPLVPIALATPTAIVMQAADLGVAHAQEELCLVRMEAYDSTHSIIRDRPSVAIENKFPCNQVVESSVDLSKLPDNSMSLKTRQHLKLEDIIASALVALVLVSGVKLWAYRNYVRNT